MDNEYMKLAKEISERNVKQHRKNVIIKYLIDNWTAITALIISIISLLKHY